MDYESGIERFLEYRPHYAYGVLKAAQLAKRLNMGCISVVEFGVARGDGLLNLEYHAGIVEQLTGVKIEVHGFDSGQGLPAVTDYRDLPYIWDAGAFPMQSEHLVPRLTRAKLYLGDVRETVPEFVKTAQFAPVGFIAHDLDLFTSTIASFAIFEGPASTRLPRVLNYFDDIILDDVALMHDEVGELAAITQFNLEHARMRLKPAIYLLDKFDCPFKLQWYVLHDIAHPQYMSLMEKPQREIA